ncbi:protein TIFY 10B-like [Cucumis melo var. makuwa]|nr:protein TIFY 10B-like [Cucumis melo var. makuwa]
MTIFYAGKVLVYDDFPNERAKEIMALADKGSRGSTTTAAAPPAAVAPNRFFSALEKPNSNSPTGEPNVVSKTPAPVKPAPEQQLKPQTEVKKSSGN